MTAIEKAREAFEDSVRLFPNSDIPIFGHAELEALLEAVRAHERTNIRVVAVAVQTSDGVVHSLPPPNRHHNVIHALHYAGIDQGGREEQGFLLSDGSFADRPRALIVARAAGQVLRETGPHIGLFSEDVW